MSQSLEAALARERAALGAAILDCTGKQARVLVSMLKPEHFLPGLNRSVFLAIRQLLSRDQVPLDYSTVISELLDMGVFEQYSNGWTLVSELGNDVVLARPMAVRVRDIKTAAAQRKRTNSQEILPVKTAEAWG